MQADLAIASGLRPLNTAPPAGKRARWHSAGHDLAGARDIGRRASPTLGNDVFGPETAAEAGGRLHFSDFRHLGPGAP